MCGIVGFTGARAAAPLLLEGLKRLEYRGYDSAGIAVMGDAGIQVEKVSGKVQKLCAGPPTARRRIRTRTRIFPTTGATPLSTTASSRTTPRCARS